MQAVDPDNSVSADIVAFEQHDLDSIERTPTQADLVDNRGIGSFAAANSDNVGPARWRQGQALGNRARHHRSLRAGIDDEAESVFRADPRWPDPRWPDPHWPNPHWHSHPLVAVNLGFDHFGVGQGNWFGRGMASGSHA